MKKELDSQLCQEFPNLYRQRGEHMSRTGMCWGFQHGDGWFQIIHDLSKELEEEIAKYRKKYGNEAADQIAASCVKEKFGTLRFYLTTGTDRMHWLIDIAERRTSYTCEECGSEEGIHSSDGWVRTLCIDHWTKHLAHKAFDHVHYGETVGTRIPTYGENKGKEIPAVVHKNEEEAISRIQAYMNLAVAMDRSERNFFPSWYRYSQRKGLVGYIENKVRGTISALSYLRHKWWWKQRPERVKYFVRYKLFLLGRILKGKRIG